MERDKKNIGNIGKYRYVKRTLDIIFSIVFLILLSWLFLIITIINLFCSHGRPYYRDPRIGRFGKKIKIIKFTSMRIDAEENADEYLSDEQMESWNYERKVEEDPRVTTFGKFLRKTSLDELPQLINILLGTMSFVGPRPITKKELKMHFTQDESDRLLSVKPGLTGNWAVNGRNNVEYKNHKRQELELEYCKKVTFLQDVKIILKTVVVIFRLGDVK